MALRRKNGKNKLISMSIDHHQRKHLLFVAMFFMIAGCVKLGTYTHHPKEGIIFSVELKKLEPQSKHNAVFLHFDLAIENDSPKPTYFDPGKMQAKLNGELSKATYYDSLASVMPERKELTNGKTTYQLYFVFPETVGTKVEEFDIVSFGLS